jgi:hypothetical protein
VARRDARAARGNHGVVLPHPGRAHLRTQLGRLQQAAVGADHLGRRQVARAGDVPGPRVDGLELARITVAGARVEQHARPELVDAGQPRGVHAAMAS